MDMHTMYTVMLNNIKSDDKDRLYNAVVSNDVSQIFSCASDIVDKSNCFPVDFFLNTVITDKRQKNPEKSDQLRKDGNKYYGDTVPDLKQALLCYFKALANAPKNSQQMMLAYSNISAVLFGIKSHKDCVANIDAALALECTGDLKQKLKLRKTNVCKLLKSPEQTDVSYFQELLSFGAERNEEISSVHEDVTVKVDGKIAIARNDIASCKIVVLERAFMSSLTDDIYLSCYYCHGRRFFFIPCDNCEALFCSEICKEKCMQEYHRIECQIIKYLGDLYEPAIVKLVTRTVIKLTLMMGWDEYIESSRLIGTVRLQKATVQEAFDSQNPLSVLSYVDDEGPHLSKLYQGSLMFAVIVDSLSYVKGYFPDDYSDEAAKLALGSVMLHLYAKFSRRIEIASPTYDFLTNKNKDRASRNLGLFAFTSKLKPACDPNLLMFGMNDSIALVTARKIKKGEEFTISYIDNFDDIAVVSGCTGCKSNNGLLPLLLRQNCLQEKFNVTCECRICIQNLGAETLDSGKQDAFMSPMWNTQPHFLLRVTSEAQTWVQRLALTASVLDGDTIPVNRFMALRSLRAIFHIMQLLKTKNVAYNATTRSSYSQAFTWPIFGEVVKPSMFK